MPKLNMILWAHAKKEEFNVIAERGYEILMILKEFGDELNPKYFPGRRKKDCKEFDGSYDTFYTTLKKNVNKEGKNLFEDLGYSINFFSSMNDSESSGISLHIGSSNPLIKNTLVVHMPAYLFKDIGNINKINKAFSKICEIFNPFWGAITDPINIKRFEGKYIQKNLPTTVHWINFWGNEIVNIIGEDNILKSSLFIKEKIKKGYILHLKHMPIDESNIDDIKLQNEINTILNL